MSAVVTDMASWERGRNHGRQSALKEIAALHIAIGELTTRNKGYLKQRDDARDLLAVAESKIAELETELETIDT